MDTDRDHLDTGAHRPRPDGRSGFTLIELIIAITITALAFIGIFSVIRAGIGTQLVVRELSDAERLGPAILAQISEDLRNAYFYNLAENDCFDGRPVEYGSDVRLDQIHLVTTRSSLLKDDSIGRGRVEDAYPSPITEVSWMLKPSPLAGFYELHRREQPFCDEEPFKGGYVRMVCDRILSLKVQYTGWNLGGAGADPNEAGISRSEQRSRERAQEQQQQQQNADPNNPLAAFGAGEAEGQLLWEDSWNGRERGGLPVAAKIELVVSPDIDPEVMKYMTRDGRLEELDKSYVHIILFPQFREDQATMRSTYEWDGTVTEPAAVVGGGRAGGANRQGGGRGRGADGQPQQGGTRGAPAGGQGGQNPLGSILGGANQGANNGGNPFLNILRGR